jgi:hypothetical protein
VSTRDSLQLRQIPGFKAVERVLKDNSTNSSHETRALNLYLKACPWKYARFEAGAG